MKTAVAVIFIFVVLPVLWAIWALFSIFAPQSSSSSQSRITEDFRVATSTPAISDLGPVFRGRGAQTIPLVRLNRERNYEVSIELEDECRYNWTMTGVGSNWNLSGSGNGVSTAKEIVSFQYGGDFLLSVSTTNQRCSWSIVFSYTVLPHTVLPDLPTSTTTSGSRNSSPSGGCSTDADCGGGPYGEERENYGDDYWPDEGPNWCDGDCNDMDNDGRTWDDVDADRDGCYESRGSSC